MYATLSFHFTHCFLLLDFYAFLSSYMTFVFWSSYIVKYLTFGQAFPSWNCSSYFFQSILFGKDLTCSQTLSKESKRASWYTMISNCNFPCIPIKSWWRDTCTVFPESSSVCSSGSYRFFDHAPMYQGAYFSPAFLHVLTEVSFLWSESLSLLFNGSVLQSIQYV